MNLYDATIPIFTKAIRNVEGWLDKAVEHAAATQFDPEVLTVARLAPGQWALARQIQAACDAMKFCAAKMTGKEPPSHPDTEKTLDELRGRLRTVADYLATFTPDDFVGCEDRPVSHTWMQGKTVRAGDYLDHWALPNLYFHLVTVYAILRHNGVPLTKTDYVGSLPFQGE